MLNSGGEKNIVRKKNSERNKKTHKHPPPKLNGRSLIKKTTKYIDV